MTDDSAASGPALLIDLDGVIYEADRPIAGAAEAIAWVQKLGLPHLFLTNTTSRPRSALVSKLAGMGIETDTANIITPTFAANRWLRDRVEGPVALFIPDGAIEEFSDVTIAEPGKAGSVAAVVVGDYSDRWTFAELNRAFRLLMMEPRPVLVALGMTRYWHAEDGLRLDTAPFVVALEHATDIEPTVLGKPARPFFEMARAAVGSEAAETWMIGDDVRSDVGGAQRAGLKGMLVKTGKFRSGDLGADVRPDAILDSIAGLSGWWEAEHTRAR